MLTFLITMFAIIALLGLVMGCDLLRDRTDAHSRFVGGVMLGCSLILSSFVALLIAA